MSIDMQVAAHTPSFHGTATKRCITQRERCSTWLLLNVAVLKRSCTQSNSSKTLTSSNVRHYTSLHTFTFRHSNVKWCHVMWRLSCVMLRFVRVSYIILLIYREMWHTDPRHCFDAHLLSFLPRGAAGGGGIQGYRGLKGWSYERSISILDKTHSLKEIQVICLLCITAPPPHP